MNLDGWRILLDGARRYDDGSGCVPLKYGEAGAAEVETGIFLYGLVRRAQPRVIVETGTNRGWSSACMALALKDNGAGHLWTCDINEYEGEKYELWERLDLTSWITPVCQDSRIWTPPQRIDLLFLDSDHWPDFVLSEWRHFAPSLSSVAHILVHDTSLEQGRLRPTVEAIAAETRGRHIVFAGWRGLDVVQVVRA